MHHLHDIYRYSFKLNRTKRPRFPRALIDKYGWDDVSADESDEEDKEEEGGARGDPNDRGDD